MLNFEIESSIKILVDQLVSLGAAAAGDTRIAALICFFFGGAGVVSSREAY